MVHLEGGEQSLAARATIFLFPSPSAILTLLDFSSLLYLSRLTKSRLDKSHGGMQRAQVPEREHPPRRRQDAGYDAGETSGTMQTSGVVDGTTGDGLL